MGEGDDVGEGIGVLNVGDCTGVVGGGGAVVVRAGGAGVVVGTGVVALTLHPMPDSNIAIRQI